MTIYTIPSEGFFLANASTAINCSATNCSNGFVTGEASTLTRCTARNNTNKGFSLSNNCVVSECVAVGNGTSGLENIKTLQDIETRIPIPASSTATGVFTISSSGSYYFQGDRLCSGTGIQVNVDNVTIELCGFSLIGPGADVNYGIFMNSRKNVEIRDGTVRGFGKHGIYDNNVNAKYIRVISVRLMANGDKGIYLLGKNHLVKDCMAAMNGGDGIKVSSSDNMVSNIACDNGGHGIVTAGGYLKDNTANHNQKNGIRIESNTSHVVHNMAYDNNQSGASWADMVLGSSYLLVNNYVQQW